MDGRENFLRLLLRHELDVRAFIGSLVPDRAQRDDVFQEVALALWQGFDAYDPSRPFGAWARGVAANKVLEHRRRDHRFPLAFAPETVLALRDAYDRTEPAAPARREALDACLEGVPGHSRRLLALRYEHDLSGDEIGRRTGRTAEAVYQALSRVRALLEDCIRRRLAGAEGGA